jgi:FtsP/CotA-like multicopper oxidase with cupredoxin domain
MHHPFHIHRAGRLIVLARDSVTEEHLVWKDTVVVRIGQTVDILLDVTNRRVWRLTATSPNTHESSRLDR